MGHASWNTAFVLSWSVWLASWLLAARWANRTRTKADRAEQLTWSLPTGLGVVLVWAQPAQWAGWNQLWTLPDAGQAACLLAVAAGFAFTWWARIHLGRLWSGNITLKDDHRIVDTGPYRLVRHPIYTGLYLALAATSIGAGRLTALLGVAIIFWATWRKARHEERFLRAELGAEAYDSYASRTPMLLPFWPMKG